MQRSGPRDIVIYWPGPRAFSVVQKPWGWAHTSVQKPRGARGGMVTGQIDTYIILQYIMYGHIIYYWFTIITLAYYIGDGEYIMSSDCGDLLLSLSEAMLYPKQAHLFSFELFLVININPAFLQSW